MDAARQVPDSPSVDPREVEHFRRFAETWWDPVGPFWPLHRLNALRVPWIRDRACAHFGRSATSDQPLDGLRILDIGCGGGILSESMARLGATVLGIDVVERNLQIASDHAAKTGTPVRYQLTSAEALAAEGQRYDIVLNMEVVEHVADLPGFMSAAAALLRPQGQMFLATINRNPLAWFLAIFGAEYVLRWLPKGTHHYRLLRKPSEIEALLARDGIAVQDRTGVRVDPLRKQLHLTRSLAVNYMMSTHRPAFPRTDS